MRAGRVLATGPHQRPVSLGDPWPCAHPTVASKGAWVRRICGALRRNASPGILPKTGRTDLTRVGVSPG
jgi:hypothetical protein